jgi:hypothetical protein
VGQGTRAADWGRGFLGPFWGRWRALVVVDLGGQFRQVEAEGGGRLGFWHV